MDEKQDRNSSPGPLSLPENSTNVHKRSSSDAGVSYHIQQHRERKARRRKELGFQIIDQQGVSIADGRSKNIQSVLVSINNFKISQFVNKMCSQHVVTMLLFHQVATKLSLTTC